MSPAITSDDKNGDFRSRVAAERRERMQARLLDAVLDLYQPQPGHGGTQPLIDDVIRAAEVSRGSFYKYFESVEHAVTALGERFTAENMQAFEMLFGQAQDPALKAIGGTAMTISRAWHDPRWGGFTTHVDHVEYFSRASSTNQIVRECLADARRQGQMHFDSLDVAFDLIVGATVQARRRLVNGVEAPRAYVDEMLQRLFLGLGMQPDALAATTQTAWRRIAENAPQLGWWRTDCDWHQQP
ncbi:TPA: TetR/AcrR family transcriptional regulator [Pseudomonas aeruginosa]